MATDISFVKLSSILKVPSGKEGLCSQWVATEKVHGSSFQFYTSDGETVHTASRNQCLDGVKTFMKCNMDEFRSRYNACAKNIYKEVRDNERWQAYRAGGIEVYDKENDEEDDADMEQIAARRESEMNKAGEQDNLKSDMDNSKVTTQDDGSVDSYQESAQEPSEVLEVRIYGELYGGGGVTNDGKNAVQREILYSDQFRFYVFGITINRKWVNITELCSLCKGSGFPYYAEPVCEPKASMEELKQYIVNSGYLATKSRLTDREDTHRTNVEGVVMSPLVRPDFCSYRIKLLSAAFNDVKYSMEGTKSKNGKKPAQPNYCTKARFLSVISKLDTPEREDVDNVVSLFIKDIEKESGETLPANKKNGCAKAVRGWLIQEGCITKEGEPQSACKNHVEKPHRERNEDTTAAQGKAGATEGNDNGENDDDDDGDDAFEGFFGDT